MAMKPGAQFKVWTAFLSMFVALTLFPNIVGKHGVWMSLFITALSIGAIWLIYIIVSRLINWAVTEELKKRAFEPKSGPDDRAAPREDRK